MNFFKRWSRLFRRAARPQPLDVSARFQLQQEAFTGTMSKFRVAREISTGRLVGIKFLDAEKSAQFKARFKGLNKPSEGEIASRIKHPCVVETYEFGLTTTGVEYILMEYIPGPSLSLLIRDQDPRMIAARLNMIRQMASAIQAVHDAGFIHRDICPRNFIADSDVQTLKLIDFGLTVPDEPPYRLPGNRTGTPQYMAPEIVRRRHTDPRVDIFAFGVTAFRMLTNAHPWGSTDTSGVGALTHDARPATELRQIRPELDERLARAIERCMRIRPDDRPNSMKTFLAAIGSVTSEIAS